MAEPGTDLLELNIHNGRNFSAGTLSITVGVDDLVVRRQHQELGSFGRKMFREWLSHPRDEVSPEGKHNTTWSMRGGVLVVTAGPYAASVFVVLPDEVDRLREAV